MSIAIYTYRDPYKLNKETYWEEIKGCPYFCVSQTLVNGLKTIYKNDFQQGRVTTIQYLIEALFEYWESTACIVKQHTDIDNIISAGLPPILGSDMQENIARAFLYNREEVFESIRVMFELNININDIVFDKLTPEQKFIVEVFRKILTSEKKKDFFLKDDFRENEIDIAINHAMQRARKDLDCAVVNKDCVVIHGVHQFSPIMLRAIERMAEYKKVILLFNYQPQYKNIYQTWDANMIEQRIGRLDRLERDPERPVVHSVAIYTEDTFEEALFNFWNNGLKIFTQSLSGMEIIMKDINAEIISAVKEDFKYGLFERVPKIIEIADSMRETVRKEQNYDAAGFMFRPMYAELKRLIDYYAQNENALFASTMTNWATINVKTNTNFDLLPQAERLVKYPKNIFFADYPDSVYSVSPVVRSKNKNGCFWRLCDCELSIHEISSDQQTIKVRICADDVEQIFSCDTKGYYSSDTENFYVSRGTNEEDLASYLTNHPLRIKTFDDTIIEGFEIYKGPSDETLSYDKNQINGVDWDEYNTDVKVEFIKKGTKIAKGKKSIQDTLREILLSDPKNKYVLYDHGTGEMADYITIQEETNQWIVKLYHVKKKSAAGYNNSMNDVYEVAGQAVKSIIWLSSTAKLIDKIRSRQQSSHCVPIKGDSKALLKELRGATKQLAGYIVIVQPGLSKSTNMNIKVQEVLASAASYISRAGRVKGLEVIGSK